MNLQEVLQRADVWRGGAVSPAHSLPSGNATLDELLGGGWPRDSLIELFAERQGIGELRMLLPLLAQLSLEERWIAFVGPTHIPYAPALVRAGVDLRRVLVVHPRSVRDAAWATEQALRAGTCSIVLVWSDLAGRGSSPSPRAGEGRGGADGFGVLRRLQLAAEAGESMGVLFRSPLAATESSPAALRLKLAPQESGALSVQVLKRRGGWPAAPVTVEVDRYVVARHLSRRPAARGLLARRSSR